MKGLKARGGFEVALAWENNKPKNIPIKSELGGNFRIRSFALLEGENLEEAKTENPNEFYSTPEIKKALISEEANLKELKFRKVYEYDLRTSKGEEYVVKIKPTE